MADSLGTQPVVLLLGPMRVEVDSDHIEVRGAKQRILLAHMVLSNGRPVSLSRLISDLWGGSPPRNANHSLQEHVSRLRTTLQVNIELMEGTGYRLSPELVGSDVRRFARLCKEGRRQLEGNDPGGALETLEKAFGLWRGPILDDLGDIDGLRSHKLQVEEMWRHVVSSRIDAYLACARGDEVIADIRASLDRDPLREHTWYQYISALDQSSRRNEALQAFHDARELFIDVLGVEPSARLSGLHTSLLRANETERAHDRTTADTPPRHARRESALVGRSYEVSTFERLWQDSNEELQVVTLSGEPGVGKSRLASEFTRMATAEGALVLRGDCRQGATVAYQPFAQMLRGTIDFAHQANIATRTARHAAGLARVLPEMSSLFSPESQRELPTRSGSKDVLTMEAIAAWFEAVSLTRPLIIVLEDLQWADEQSVLVLDHLIRSTRTIKGTVVVTVRDHQLTDLANNSSVIPQLLEQSPGITHLAIGKLAAQETTQLVDIEASQARTGPLPDWADSYVQDASGGNPLYTIELTRHLLATGALADGKVPPPPAGLRQVIEGHLSTLDERASDLLRQAAAFGTEFNPAYLTHVTELSAIEVDELLLQALGARLIKPIPGSASPYRFSHDVVRAVLYESIPPLERASLHTRIAQALAAPGSMSHAQHLQELAHHQQLSDAPDGKFHAAVNLKDAGYQALDKGAPAEAGALLAQALELLGETADPGVLCDTLIGLGAAQLRYADPEYRTTLLRAARVAMKMGDSARVISAVLLNSRGWWSSSTQIDHERVETIEAALAACDPEDRAAYAQLLAAWAQENVRDPGSRDDVLDRSAQALSIADQLGDVEVLATALTSRYVVMYALFEGPAECVTLSQRLLELGQSQGDRMMVLSSLTCLAQSSMRFGDYQVADRCVEHAQQLARTLHHPPRLWLAQGWVAMREATRGRFESAHQIATETYELGVRTGQLDASTWYMGQMYTFALMRGALPEIVADIGEHVAEVVDAIPAWRAAMALALAHAGQQEQAEAMLEDFAAGDFEQLPRDILWLNGMGYLAMTCEAVGRQDVAATLYEQLLPYSGMVASNGTIDAGPVDLHLGILARLVGNHEGAAAHLNSAVALSRKFGATVWLAQAQERLVTA